MKFAEEKTGERKMVLADVLGVVQHYPEPIVSWFLGALKKANYSTEYLLLLGQPENQQMLEEFRLVLERRAKIVFERQEVPQDQKESGEGFFSS